MKTTMSKQSRPWYRQPLVWMIIAIPLSAVIAGIYTFRLAVISDDGLVVDDYYRKGKEINLDLSRDKAALAHGLNADIRIDYQQGTISLTP